MNYASPEAFLRATLAGGLRTLLERRERWIEAFEPLPEPAPVEFTDSKGRTFPQACADEIEDIDVRVQALMAQRAGIDAAIKAKQQRRQVLVRSVALYRSVMFTETTKPRKS